MWDYSKVVNYYIQFDVLLTQKNKFFVHWGIKVPPFTVEFQTDLVEGIEIS